MKYIMMVVVLLGLSGCTIEPDYKKALENYAKDQCKGKLKSVNSMQVLNEAGYHCITDKGVEYTLVQLNEIPVKYWEIE